MDFLLRSVPRLLWRARQQVANFIGAEPQRLVFTTNVTSAINLVASSVSIPPSGEVLLSDHEYIPMRWGWERAAERRGLSFRTFYLSATASSPDEIVESV